jgi:hypothetical protein
MREKCEPAPAPAWRGPVPVQMWEGRAQSRCSCGSGTGLAPATSAPQPAGLAPATAAPGLGPPLPAFAPGIGRVVLFCVRRYVGTIGSTTTSLCRSSCRVSPPPRAWSGRACANVRGCGARARASVRADVRARASAVCVFGGTRRVQPRA